MAAPAEKAKKPAYSIAKCYKVEGDKLVERPKPSPKKNGTFMANHKDRYTCGATTYTEIKGKEQDKPAEEKAPEAKKA